MAASLVRVACNRDLRPEDGSRHWAVRGVRVHAAQTARPRRIRGARRIRRAVGFWHYWRQAWACLCRTADVPGAAHGHRRGVAWRDTLAHPAEMAERARCGAQRGHRPDGARPRPRRRVRLDRERAVGCNGRAGPQPAAGADLDDRQSLARRARAAAAMGWARAWDARHLSDRARQGDHRQRHAVRMGGERGGALWHHGRHALSKALWWRDRLAAGALRAICGGGTFVCVRGGRLRNRRRGLDAAISLRAWLARFGFVVRRGLAALLPDPPRPGDAGRKPVLSDAAGDGADGMGAVQRTARAAGASRHDCLRPWRVLGQLEVERDLITASRSRSDYGDFCFGTKRTSRRFST